MTISRVELHNDLGLVNTLDFLSISITQRLDEPGEFRLDLPTNTELPDSGNLFTKIYTGSKFVGGGRVLNRYQDDQSLALSGRDQMDELRRVSSTLPVLSGDLGPCYFISFLRVGPAPS